jgi:hypothetical protein
MPAAEIAVQLKLGGACSCGFSVNKPNAFTFRKRGLTHNAMGDESAHTSTSKLDRT